MDNLKSLILNRGLFEYKLKPVELLWAVIQGAGAFIVTTTIAPVNAKDWETWAIALTAAGARAAAATIFGRQA